MGIFATIDLVPAADEAPASVLLRPKENLLVLEVLHYRHQVTQPAALASEAPQTEVAPEELKMAKTLVNASTGDFTLDKYPDLYTRKLQQLIEAKVAGKEIVAAPASEGPQVINLMEALKQSVARVQGTNSARKESRKSTRRLVRKIS
jgi:DNA end-binding protein Ku